MVPSCTPTSNIFLSCTVCTGCLSVDVGPNMRLQVVFAEEPQSVGDVFPQLFVGTDVTIDSDNYWSIRLHQIEVVAQYRGNRIAFVQLAEGLTVPNKGTATFPVDLSPDVEDPLQSGQHYASDCVVPQAEQETAGATAGVPVQEEIAGDSTDVATEPTWPMTLIVTVQVMSVTVGDWSWTPTFSVTIPDIEMPCVSVTDNSASILIPLAPSGSNERGSDCLIGS